MFSATWLTPIFNFIYYIFPPFIHQSKSVKFESSREFRPCVFIFRKKIFIPEFRIEFFCLANLLITRFARIFFLSTRDTRFFLFFFFEIKIERSRGRDKYGGNFFITTDEKNGRYLRASSCFSSSFCAISVILPTESIGIRNREIPPRLNLRRVVGEGRIETNRNETLGLNCIIVFSNANFGGWRNWAFFRSGKREA